MKGRIEALDPRTTAQVKALLESKMRPIYFALFEDELQKNHEHLIFGNDNNLNISFDPLQNKGQKNDSLLINQDSESDCNSLNSFTKEQDKKDKDCIEFIGNESLSDDGNLQDLL